MLKVSLLKEKQCESDTCEISIANELKDKNSFHQLSIINDLDLQNKQFESYENLLENVTFKRSNVTPIRIDPPFVKKLIEILFFQIIKH